METEELIKLVDGIYKNILDKFNPGARQMINAGKAYLKALHGAAAASRLYVDAISKLAKQAQQGTWGGCSDIGQALLKVVEVYKDIQDQQMNILKAFYVDLLVPLETNLEKDTKVVQSEQKRFLQQHKQRAETYSKAAANMKKQRKKSKGTSKGGLAMDKELKNMQMLEEEKTKLDAFCEQSLKNAMTQERRRYGFVLERHCSLTKHYLSYHTQSAGCYQQNLDKWLEVAKTREYLPDAVENIFNHKIKQVSIWQDDDFYSNPRSPHYDDDRMSLSSQLRKTKSMDASCLDIRSIQEVGSPVNTLSRAKSEFNLNSSSNSLTQVEMHSPARRPKSMAVPPVPPPQWETQLARALYAYLSSGDNQLSFLEGDVIALIGDRNKGWQFGENLRTQSTGWFPLAYTEILDETAFSPKHRSELSGSTHTSSPSAITSSSPMSPGLQSNTSTLDTSTPRMFGDTLHIHRSSANAKQIRRAIASNNIPPPALPAPIPAPTLPYTKSGISQSQSTNFVVKPNSEVGTFSTSHPPGMRTSTSSFNFTTPTNGSYSTHPQTARTADKPMGVNPLPLHLQTKGGKIGGPVGNVSLHSSNDSGFSNDPPPQPEIDYSDDDSTHGQTKVPVRLNRRQSISDTNNNQMRKVNPVRPSRSSNNLTESRHYTSDDQSLILYADEKKSFVKRTKSFWKFGKNGSDSEVLEGMALWKHRDLVDINEKERRQRMIKRKVVENGNGKASPNGSHDSDRTLNAKQYQEVEPSKPKVDARKRRESFKDKGKLSLPPPRRESGEKNEDFENHFEKRPSPHQFYDDEDGLVLKTVNRKSILQKYSNDSTEQDSDSGSESNTDDPYDCIVINDQQMKKNREATNVAAIGKKLERLSKNSKYSPTKERTPIDEKRHINENENDTVKIKNERNSKQSKQTKQQQQRHTFKTFGIEIQNDENGEHEINEGKFYAESYTTSTHEKKEPRRTRRDNTNSSSKMRSSYESINSEVDVKEAEMKRSSSKSPKKYYNERASQRDARDTTSADEFSDAVESRQFLPRTKLTKTNSNNSQQGGLTDYGETLQRRLKSPDYDCKFEETKNGNMYGPWYDLWGLDRSVRK